MTKLNEEKAPQGYHWYLSTAAGWAVDESLPKLIDKARKQCGYHGKVKKGERYLIAKVPVPLKEDYRIAYYLPQVDGLEIVEEGEF